MDLKHKGGKHNLAKRVKEFRRKKGLSREQLVKSSGLSLRIIQRGDILIRPTGPLKILPDRFISSKITENRSFLMILSLQRPDLSHFHYKTLYFFETRNNFYTLLKRIHIINNLRSLIWMKRFKKILITVSLVFGILGFLYFLGFFIRKIRTVDDSQKINTAHFSITYKGILVGEAKSMANTLESNYNRIRTELGDPEHGKIAVYVHPTQKGFNNATGLINSKADGTSRGPFTFHLMYQTWFNSFFPADMNKVAVHEFTHCVQLNILIQDALSKAGKDLSEDFDQEFEKNFSKNYPQWFWEAVCDYEAGIVNRISVEYGMKNNPTLKELNNSNQVYNVGYTVVEYFVSKYGKEKLPEFIRSYGNFEKVLGVTEKEFEQGWHQFVDENY